MPRHRYNMSYHNIHKGWKVTLPCSFHYSIYISIYPSSIYLSVYLGFWQLSILYYLFIYWLFICDYRVTRPRMRSRSWPPSTASCSDTRTRNRRFRCLQEKHSNTNRLTELEITWDRQIPVLLTDKQNDRLLDIYNENIFCVFKDIRVDRKIDK